MKIHKILIVGIFSLILTACGINERKINNANVDTFIEELSDFFEIEEKPRVYVSEYTDDTTYDLENFSIEVTGDRELFQMYLFSDEKESEKLIEFLGLPFPDDFYELEPGDSTQIFGDYVSVTVSRNDKERTQQFREQAEEDGKYYDEREDYSVNVIFFGEENM